MKCPTCGAENDPANRFCDQCGTKLDPVAASAPTEVAAPVVQASGPSICPNCGASVLPGEAFCDNCGQPLGAAPVVAGDTSAADAPTIVAPVIASTTSAPATENMVVCANCGHQNMAGDTFCENCGADLATAQPATAAEQPAIATAAPAAEMTAPPVVGNDEGLPIENVPAADQHFQDQGNGAPASAETAIAEAAEEAAPAPAQAEPEAAPAPAEPTAEATPTAPSTDAERQRLTEEIARQDMVIAQFEQMQTMFGENTPPSVSQGLAQARDARAQAETALAALPAATPAIDPAEVARLNEEIARQDQIIAQFEQMQTMFGAATPPAVTDGLTQARDARQKATDDLAALTGGNASLSAPAPAATEAPPAATEVPEAVPAPAPAAAIAVPSGPRLVVEANGVEVSLAQDKTELILGREDPISGIFPEVDLTPYGGENGGVSRQHAKLLNNSGQWSIVDLNSTNYTRVNGTKLDPNVPTAITDGSRIQLGRVVMVFKQ